MQLITKNVGIFEFLSPWVPLKRASLYRTSAHAYCADVVRRGAAPQVISTVEKVLFLKGVDLFKSIPGEDPLAIAAIAGKSTFLRLLIFQEVSQWNVFLILSVQWECLTEVPWSPVLDLNSASVKWHSLMPGKVRYRQSDKRAGHPGNFHRRFHRDARRETRNCLMSYQGDPSQRLRSEPLGN